MVSNLIMGNDRYFILKGKKMRMIALSVGLMGCLFVLGCASGRYPEPVLSYMPGDGAMNCEELRVEMAKVRQEMILKRTKIKKKDIVRLKT